MNSHQVFLVRHGETEWSKASRHTGRTDLPLTNNGRAAAAALAPRLATFSFAAVFTSPLLRAASTCELAGLGAQAQPDRDLMEWDYGFAEGKTTPEIQVERPGWSVWDGPVLDGESLAQVSERTDRVLARVKSISGNVLLFAHAHLLRILTARWLGQDPAFGNHLVLSPASISILGYDRSTPAITAWNT